MRSKQEALSYHCVWKKTCNQIEAPGHQSRKHKRVRPATCVQQYRTSSIHTIINQSNEVN